MKYNSSLKEMAEYMSISSAHLSALEYGDKKLNDRHIRMAVLFLESAGANDDELYTVEDAGARSMESINLEPLNGDARSLVVAFARSLQDGGKPPSQEIIDYLKTKKA